MIDPELLPEFVAEASEHLDEMEVNLIKLETDPENLEIINDIFRDVHTIKGSSAYLGLSVTSELAHKLENILEIVRQGKRNVDASLVDTLMAARDRLSSLVADVEGYQEERTQTDDLIEAIERSLNEPGEKLFKKVAKTIANSPISISEEEISLSLDDIFDLESNQADVVAETTSSVAHSQVSPGPAPDHVGTSGQDGASDAATETIEETGEDQELFAIYIEQLHLNLSDIQELAAQIPISEDLHQLLSEIRQKIGRLNGSANYMGYDKLVSLCKRWQDTLATFQDQLSSTEAISRHYIFQEGIATFFHIIQHYFPQLGEIALVEKDPAGVAQQANALQHDEEELTLELDDIFDSQEEQPNFQERPDGLLPQSEPDPLPARAEPALQGGHTESIIDTTEDAELVAIFIEQLQRHLLEIREVGEQLIASDERSALLVAIDEKLQRLKASANYMGYDSLVGLCARWQNTLAGFKDQLSLTPPPTCAMLIDEGINTYLATISKLFPQLDTVEPVDIAAEAAAPCSPSPASSHNQPPHQKRSASQPENEYEENIDTELFSIFLEQLKDNLQVVQTLAHQIPANENPQAVLHTLTKKITRIRAAANYMGYEKLTGLYDQWVDELKELDDSFSLFPTGTELSSQIGNCIGEYAKKLYDIFPQIQEKESTPPVQSPARMEQQIAVTPPSTTEQEPSLDAEKDSSLVDRTEELFSSTAVDQEEEDFLSEEPTFHEEIVIGEKQMLADRLSAALDDALKTERTASIDQQLSPPDNNLGALLDPKQNAEGVLHCSEEESQEHEVVPQPTEPSESTQPVPPSPAPAENDPTTADEFQGVERRKGERRKTAESGVEKVFRQSLRIDANKIDELMNQAGELVINRAWFSQLFNELRRMEVHLQNIPELDKREVKQVKSFSFKFHEAIVALGRVANELQEGVMKVRMLPISQLFNRYPRLIRDLVHDTDKDIGLVLRGADTELDKMIIEEIADPLIHVIRNAVDHGIEPAATRRSLGKPEKGLLKLDAYHEDSHVVVEVTDDGRGIDLEAVQSKALAKGLISKEQLDALSPKEITELIMRPGFSTAAEVTRTSGRGVGMDVVRKNLENLNGTIEIDSQPGQGTNIRIKIPLTLAVIKALLVKVGTSLFTIPLIAVDETLQVRDEEIHSIKSNEVIYLRDSTIPLIRLSTIFNLPILHSQSENDEKTFVVIVSAGKSRVGLVVDALRGQEEVVIKPLPDYLRDNRGFSGATILGDGRISLILDIHDLVHLTIGRQNRRINEPATMTSES